MHPLQLCTYPSTGDVYDCTSIFDADFYRQSYPESTAEFRTYEELLNHFLSSGLRQGFQPHRGDRVLKLIVMHKNALNLLQPCIFYHGHIFGFENLYVLDGSTDQAAQEWLDLARSELHFNVFRTPTNLNGIADEWTAFLKTLSHSADFFVKIDVDEFLVPPDVDQLPADTDLKVAMRRLLNELPFDGGILTSLKSFMSCPDPIGCANGQQTDVRHPNAHYQHENTIKSFLPSWTFEFLDLGGHSGLIKPGYREPAISTPDPFATVHLHWQCWQATVEAAMQVILSHGIILQDDALSTKIEKLRRHYTNGGSSYHKSRIVFDDLSDATASEKYYAQNGRDAAQCGVLIPVISIYVARIAALYGAPSENMITI
jgi:hypothetical protein